MSEKMAPVVRLPSGKLRRRDDIIIDLCSEQNVLHLACSAWPSTKSQHERNDLLHKKIVESASQAAGLDNSKEGISYLIEKGYKELGLGDLLHQGSVKSFIDTLDWTPDTIVAGEVLEHIDQPGKVIQNIRGALPGSKVVLTVPSAFALRGILRIFLLGGEKVAPDHVAYYSYSTIRALVGNYGLKIDATYWYITDAQPSKLDTVLNACMWPILKLRPQFADGLVVVCSEDII